MSTVTNLREELLALRQE